MGKVIRRLAAGTVPEQTIFDKRFVAECCETFHLHWRNLRLELTPGNWSDMLAAFNEADRKWREAGSPPEHSHLELTRFLRSEPAINGTSVGAELCENLYKTAPPEFSRDAEYYEDDEFVHFHYRDLRVEMSVEDFLGFSGVMTEARERLLERPEPLSRLFARLDAHGVLYAVSRNWENLPDAVEVGPHSDLDLIVHPAHLAKVEELWHATKTNPQTNPAQRRVPVIGPDGSESFLLVDLRAPGDGYFPEAFAHRALARRIRNPKGFWTLSPKQHFLALAYHVVHHKGVLTPDYRETLLAVAAEAKLSLIGDGTEFPQLVGLLAEHGVAFAQADDPWVGPKLPFARPVENVLSSRWLLDHAGRPVHSRIYLTDTARGPVVLKQTSGDLAKREGDVLGLLDSQRFPKVLDAEARGVDSLLTLEAVAGDPLTRTRPANAVRFAEGCIEILAELDEAGIVHRDITPHNLLVRDGLPVLIDFGWAVADGLELPPALERDLVACGLGEGGRPPEGGYCDVFAMGVALAPLAGDPHVHALVAAMTAPAGQRITDPAGLTAVLHGDVEPPAHEPVLPATSFTLLVLADELRATPGLLAAVTQGEQRVTQLVLYAPDADAEKTAAELGPLFEAPGASGLDVVLMAVPGSAENEAGLASKVDAVPSGKPLQGAFAGLPRFILSRPTDAKGVERVA